MSRTYRKNDIYYGGKWKREKMKNKKKFKSSNEKPKTYKFRGKDISL